MLKLAQITERHCATESLGVGAPRSHAVGYRYFAFLSYSHEDKATADWLHRMLEKFRVPRLLVGRATGEGVVPTRLTPIFRDRQELPAAEDLGAEIRSALGSSQFLIVLCSPAAAKSRWTDAEIDAFKRLRPDGRVLAAIVDGEPFASSIPGREHEECFPRALRHKYDRRGRATSKRAEPIAADFRESRDGQRIGFLKLVAGLVGVGLDELVQRETRRRQRRLALLTAASLGGMAVTSALALAAMQARTNAIHARDEAREQRLEAEALITFMLGDLRAQLDPIDRLDALDSVGNRALRYYEKQESSELSDDSLVQRSRALTLLGNVASRRGKIEAAEKFYREALAGTAETVRRNRNDPRHISEHAQIVFWIGELAFKRGDATGFELSMREYKQLAGRLVQLEPRVLKWRMELHYASTNLGVTYMKQRRFNEAAAELGQSVKTGEAIAAAAPNYSPLQMTLALAWLADAKMSEGRLKEAVSLRERQVALVRRPVTQIRDNVEYQQYLISAHQALARSYAVTGQRDMALRNFRAALASADKLIPMDNAAAWYRTTAHARLAYAGFLLETGEKREAGAQTESACGTADKLAAQTGDAEWRLTLRECWLMRGRLALSSGRRDEAALDARRAIEMAKSVTTGDRTADRHAVARAYRLLGDVQDRFGNETAARAAWSAALTAITPQTREKPTELDERARILLRLGRSADAAHINARLNAMGYRRVA